MSHPPWLYRVWTGKEGEAGRLLQSGFSQKRILSVSISVLVIAAQEKAMS